MQQQKKENQPTEEIERIMKEKDLQFVESGFFRQKKNVARMKDENGRSLILKTGRIDPLQIQLFDVARKTEKQLFFKVPAIVDRGEGWILLEEVKGEFLNEFYDKDPDWCVEISKRIADDYQLIIQEIQKTQSLGDLLAEGQEWLFSRLNLWSKPIIDAGLIESLVIQELKKDLETAIVKNGENFFGWAHGNIIGDHVIISGEEVYLLDLNAVPRAGGRAHDFLRSLDFMFLKSGNEKQIFDSIPVWIEQYLSEFDKNELELIFAFRNIGILGWDILHHKIEYVKGDLETKKQLALKFIKREI